MNAEEYTTSHWIKNKIHTHLTAPKHQKRLKDCADRLVGNIFADVGCATGHSTEIMSGFHPGLWTGIDFSKSVILEARRHFPKGTWVYIESPEDIAGKYDSIVCSEVIEHVEDDQSFIDAICRHARYRVVFTTPCVYVNDPGHLRVYDKLLLQKRFGAFACKIEQLGKFWYIVVNVNWPKA